MTLIFDTSVLIDLEKGNKRTIGFLRNLSYSHPDSAKITFVQQFEFLFGLHEKTPRNKEKSLAFLNNFGILHTTRKTGVILSHLRYKYEKKGTKMSLADLLIASIVIENHSTLVTADTDFERIEELKCIILE